MRNTLLFTSFVLFTFLGCQKDSIKHANLNLEIQNAKTGTNTNSGLKFGRMKDIDGNTYKTIQIGTQIWMAENLKVTRFRDGTNIPQITDASQWISNSTPAFCYYNNDASNNSTYGKLYNYYAMTDSRKIAPLGWHIPNDAEWNILTNYLGGETVAGGKMKETGTTLWLTPNTGATNSSGFSGRPAGYRRYDAAYLIQGTETAFWSLDGNGSSIAWYRALSYNSAEAFKGYGAYGIQNGFPIRCIKD